jgi:predicted DNA-binding transcriptional regulator AlpA
MLNEVEVLLTEKDVAKSLRVSVATVRRWRTHGGGPRFCKIGASVRYRPADVSTFVSAAPGGGGQAGPSVLGVQ